MFERAQTAFHKARRRLSLRKSQEASSDKSQTNLRNSVIPHPKLSKVPDPWRLPDDTDSEENELTDKEGNNVEEPIQVKFWTQSDGSELCNDCQHLQLEKILTDVTCFHKRQGIVIGVRKSPRPGQDVRCALCRLLLSTVSFMRGYSENFTILACSYLQLCTERFPEQSSSNGTAGKKSLFWDFYRTYNSKDLRLLMVDFPCLIAVDDKTLKDGRLTAERFRGCLLPCDDSKIANEKQTTGSANATAAEEEQESDIPRDWVFGTHCGRAVNKDVANFELIKGWLTHCRENHGACNSSMDEVEAKHLLQKIDRLRFIDCVNRQVIYAKDIDVPELDYATLSYVWGQARLEHIPEAHMKQSSRLPDPTIPVIEDAIVVTLKLGLRYLWVDQICIDQADETHKQQQILHMGAIYKLSTITIVDASSEDAYSGIAGCGKRPRSSRGLGRVLHPSQISLCSTLSFPQTVISKSKWATRGWTFQEGYLSRRRLVFTEEQAYFECLTKYAFESVSRPWKRLLRDHYDDFGLRRGYFESVCIDSRSDPRSSTHMSSNAENLDAALTSISRRTFSKASDVLNGAAGVLGEFCRHHYGLPWYLRGHEGPHKTIFLESLLWDHGDFDGTRVDAFPSFSWAGWKLGRIERLCHWTAAHRFSQDVMTRRLVELVIKKKDSAWVPQPNLPPLDLLNIELVPADKSSSSGHETTPDPGIFGAVEMLATVFEMNFTGLTLNRRGFAQFSVSFVHQAGDGKTYRVFDEVFEIGHVGTRRAEMDAVLRKMEAATLLLSFNARNDIDRTWGRCLLVPLVSTERLLPMPGSSTLSALDSGAAKPSLNVREAQLKARSGIAAMYPKVTGYLNREGNVEGRGNGKSNGNGNGSGNGNDSKASNNSILVSQQRRWREYRCLLLKRLPQPGHEHRHHHHPHKDKAEPPTSAANASHNDSDNHGGSHKDNHGDDHGEGSESAATTCPGCCLYERVGLASIFLGRSFADDIWADFCKELGRADQRLWIV